MVCSAFCCCLDATRGFLEKIGLCKWMPYLNPRYQHTTHCSFSTPTPLHSTLPSLHPTPSFPSPPFVAHPTSVCQQCQIHIDKKSLAFGVSSNHQLYFVSSYISLSINSLELSTFHFMSTFSIVTKVLDTAYFSALGIRGLPPCPCTSGDSV